MVVRRFRLFPILLSLLLIWLLFFVLLFKKWNQKSIAIETDQVSNLSFGWMLFLVGAIVLCVLTYVSLRSYMFDTKRKRMRDKYK